MGGDAGADKTLGLCPPLPPRGASVKKALLRDLELGECPQAAQTGRAGGPHTGQLQGHP